MDIIPSTERRAVDNAAIVDLAADGQPRGVSVCAIDARCGSMRPSSGSNWATPNQAPFPARTANVTATDIPTARLRGELNKAGRIKVLYG
jgi:hypothetical protein